MPEYFVYVLKGSNGKYYKGMTNNLDKRFFKSDDVLGVNYPKSKTKELKVVNLSILCLFDILPKLI